MHRFAAPRRKNKDNKGKVMVSDSDALSVTKANHKRDIMAIETAKFAVTMKGAKAFELYGHLLSNEAGHHGRR